MSMIERVAAFLKDRDENVMPHEVDDAERMESAREILKAVLGADGSIDLADMLKAIGAESVTLQPAAPTPDHFQSAEQNARGGSGRPQACYHPPPSICPQIFVE